jgi:hypothetical protein
MARVLFISGFNRSGTTLVTSATTEAAQAATLTVGHLARHMPKLAAFMQTCKEKGITPDRGVDRLAVTDSTPEEYGWLLGGVTGAFSYGPKAEEDGILHRTVEAIAKENNTSTVVLKNPWDIGNEQTLLDNFPDSKIIMVRRQISAIEDSLERAWERMATSHDYVLSLVADDEFAEIIRGIIVDPAARKKQVDDTKAKMRENAKSLAESVASLPIDRVAFISYEELREDPLGGASWAAHVVDPAAMAQAISAHTFPEFNQPGEVSDIDETWAAAWRAARLRQLEAGIVKPL